MLRKNYGAGDLSATSCIAACRLLILELRYCFEHGWSAFELYVKQVWYRFLYRLLPDKEVMRQHLG